MDVMVLKIASLMKKKLLKEIPALSSGQGNTDYFFNTSWSNEVKVFILCVF